MPSKKSVTSTYKVKQRKHVWRETGATEFERWLIDNGNESRERAAWLRECEKTPVQKAYRPRFTYRIGSLRILTPNQDNPYFTFQIWSGSSALKFADIPVDWPLECMVDWVRALGGVR